MPIILSAPPQYIGGLLYGQSNLGGHYATVASPNAALPNTFQWDNTNGGWITPIANGTRELANRLTTLTGMPVKLVCHSHGGVPITALMEGDVSGTYAEFASYIQASDIRAHFIVWHQGEGDTVVPGTEQQTYLASLDTLHQSLCNLTGKSKTDLPLICSGLSNHVGGTTDSDFTWSRQQSTLINAEGLLSGVYYSHSNRDAGMVDSLHWNGASYGRSGQRYAQTIAYLRGNVATRPRLLAVSAAIVDATHTDVTLQHGMGTDFTPTSGITGFIASNNNGATSEVPSAAVRQSATVIRLTHGSMGAAADRLVQYDYGRDPDVTAPVLDNGAISAPLINTASPLVAAGSGDFPRPIWQINALNFSYAGGSSKPLATDVAVNGGTGKTVIIGWSNSSANTVSSLVLSRAGESDVAATVYNQSGAGGFATAVLPYTGNPDLLFTFSGGLSVDPVVSVWTVLTAKISSAVPVDIDSASAGSGTTLSVNISSTAGGFILSLASQNNIGAQTCAISGDEAYAERLSQVDSGWRRLAADAYNVVAGTNDNTVTATFANNAAMTLVAASFR